MHNKYIEIKPISQIKNRKDLKIPKKDIKMKIEGSVYKQSIDDLGIRLKDEIIERKYIIYSQNKGYI